MVRLLGIVLILILLSTAGGCERAARESASVPLTPTNVRAERRAFLGAPPVIPHRPLNADCTTCHTKTGKPVPEMAFAPANPHDGAQQVGLTQNCRQCHLFRRAEDSFVENDFVGMKERKLLGDRAYPGAPPVIPHAVFMRDNCLACHAGEASRPEIRCTHTDRTNCRQCHVPVEEKTLFQSAALN